MKPDEEALRRDLNEPAFRVGEHRGKWALKGVCFPYALFFVAAAPRATGPGGFLLRSECAGYSGTAPTSQLWHGGKDAALDLAHRPHSAQGVMPAFSSWGECLYHPVDRRACDHWPGQFAEQKWTPDKTITFLLETVHELLFSPQYSHASFPAEALTVPTAFVG
jgi:hypothetical protein